jgi:hypothetical protein
MLKNIFRQIRTLAERIGLLQIPKNRADYHATDLEMVGHLLKVSQAQTTKAKRIYAECQAKIKDGSVTVYDCDEVLREVDLHLYYHNALVNLFLYGKR